MEGGVSWLLVYGRVCGLGWISVYIAISLFLGLITHLTLHIMVVGLLICLVSYFRLPPPNPALVRQVLGPEPKPDMSDAEIGKRIQGQI